MNDTLEQGSAADAAIGERVGHALARRASAGSAAMTVDLQAVHRGARFRRRRRQGVLVIGTLALFAGAGVVLGQRDLPPPAVSTPSVPLPPPDVIGAAALLPDAYGEPVNVYAHSGGVPYGVAFPRIDVWERGATRVIVRTFEDVDETPDPSDAVSATTAAATPDSSIGTPSGLEQLADDQWVQLFGATMETLWNHDSVTMRGANRDEAQALLDSLVVVSGALAPPAGFTLVEHVDAQPASTASGWITHVGYEVDSSDGVTADADEPRPYGNLWVGAAELVNGRDTLELASGTVVGAIEMIDGREVFIDYQGVRPGHQFRWIDPAGVLMYMSSSQEVSDSSIDDVELVGQRELEAESAALTERLSTEPVRAQATIDGVVLTVRGTPIDVIGCIGGGENEQCFYDINASTNEPPNVGMFKAIVDGEWIIAGYYELGGGMNPSPDLTDERFALADGTVLPVSTTIADGFAWIIVRVPAGVDAVYPDMMGDIGTTSRADRPVVVGPLS